VIEQQAHRLILQRAQLAEADEAAQHMRSQANELRLELERVQLEAEARPTVRQWTEASRELREMEDKVTK
jgi:hypothetical protein